MSKKLTVKELVEAKAHFGHVTSKLHPKMRSYVYTSKAGIYIIDLRKTLAKLKQAYEYAAKIGSKGGRVLFVGTKPMARGAMRAAAEATNGYYINHRWLGGTLTNFSTVRKSVQNLDHLTGLAGENALYEGILKKEASKMEKERQKLIQLVGGIRTMKKMPAAMFLVDPIREHIALKEAVCMEIPVVSVVDTNCNPEHVNYLIPGNDDSEDTIKIFTEVFVAGLLHGRNQFDKKLAEDSENSEAADKAHSDESADDSE